MSDEKIMVTLEELRALAEHALRVGTEAQWIKVALQWMQGAEDEAIAARADCARHLDNVHERNRVVQAFVTLSDELKDKLRWRTVAEEWPTVNCECLLRWRGDIVEAGVYLTDCDSQPEAGWYVRRDTLIKATVPDYWLPIPK